MKIFILRHGEAESLLVNDSARRLTPKGIVDTQQIISGNLPVLSSIQTVYASPLVRAQQTASIAGRLLNLQSIITIPALEPEAGVQDLFSLLEKLSETEILLVSHLPLVGVLANRLCGLAPNSIRFNTSSLVGITCDIPAEGMGELFLERHV
jgi:phosphohistidine phosphatase